MMKLTVTDTYLPVGRQVNFSQESAINIYHFKSKSATHFSRIIGTWHLATNMRQLTRLIKTQIMQFRAANSINLLSLRHLQKASTSCKHDAYVFCNRSILKILTLFIHSKPHYLGLILSTIFTGAMGQNAPNWSVNPADFEASANMTSILIVDFEQNTNDQNIVAVFVGDECRGVASPIFILDNWLYFLSIYSNTNGEEITFRSYVADFDTIISLDETIQFIPNGIYGEVTDPFSLSGTLFYDHSPAVAGILDQTIEVGGAFTGFDLDNYLTELDADSIVWSFSGNQELIVDIDINHVISITPPSSEWTGSESIIFTATDDNPNAFFSSDTSIFTVLPLDHAPQVSSIPNQTIGFLGSFSPIPLDDYLTESDEDSIVWSYTFQPPLETDILPDWTIQPENYEVTLTVTARVISQGTNATGSYHLLAAFAGDEIRGVTSAISALGEWLYFLTVYANTNGEDITFKFYDTNSNQLLPVLDEFVFTANETHGTPEDPFKLYAGHLLIGINDARATVDIVDASWAGSETVQFKATDYGTLHNYSDSTSVTFSILLDNTPLVVGIPDQTIEQGSDFQQINLDSYLTEIDGETIIWSTIGNVDLIVTIDQNNVASIVPPNTDWTGSESIIFTVTDDNPNAFFSSDTALFTVLPPDRPPQVANIPEQTIGIGGQFEFIYLDDFLTELDDDEIGWSYAFSPFVEWQGPPDWSVQPQDYEFPMNLTTMITIRDGVSDASANILGAFVGDVCRGVAEPQFILDQWLYFMTIYGDTNGDSVNFRVYHSEFGDVVSVVEKIEFISNDIVGSPENPFQMNAANLSISINSSHVAQISAIDLSWSGTEAVHFIAQDMETQHEYSDSSLIIFTILPDLSPIVAEIPHQTIDEGESFATFNLDDYLVRPEASLITWSHSGEQELIVGIDIGNVVTVSTPHEDWFGGETIRFTATDISNPVLIGWNEVVFVINGVNDAPIADDLAVVTTEDTPVDLTLSGSDIEGDSLTFMVLTGPFHGTYDGVTYSPDANYYGQDSLSYITNDGVLDSEPATSTILIHAINDLPFVESPLPDISIDEDDFGAIIIPRLEDYFSDLDVEDRLVFTGVALNAGLDSLSIGTFNIALLNFLVNNGQGILSIKRYMINAKSKQGANEIKHQRLRQRQLFNSKAAVHKDRFNLLKSFVENHTTGFAVTNDTTALVVYPTENFNGEVRIIVTATDDSSASVTDTLLLSVLSLNDAPFASDITVTTAEDTPVDLTLTGTDVDDDELTYAVVDSTLHGSLSGTVPELTYTPDLNFFGVDSFTFIVSDGSIESNPATVTIVVSPVNEAPIVHDFMVETDEDTSVTITLTGTDVDDDELTYAVVDSTLHGSLSGTVPELTYAPDINFFGADSFTFIANDGSAYSDTATVSIVVNPVNDAPVVANSIGDVEIFYGDSSLSIDISLDTVFTDVEGNTLTFTTSNSDTGIATVNISGSVLTISAADLGETTITITADDGYGGIVTDEFMVTVNVTADLANAVVFAIYSIKLKKGTEIFSGNVLVNNDYSYLDEDEGKDNDKHKFELKIDKEVTTPAGYSLKANRIQIKKDAEIGGDVYYNDLENKGTIDGTLYSPISLPLFATLPPFKSAPAGSENITVEKNQSATLDAGDYGKIEVKDKGILTLTGGVYNVKSIKLKKKAKLRFADSSEVRVIDKIEIGKETYVGPADGSLIDATDIIFYVAGDHKAAKIDIGEKTQFFGTVYAPDGKIKIKKKVEATGAFMAKEVEIDKEVELALSGYFGRASNYPVSRLAWTEPILEVLPDVFALSQNFPNPFNPVTQIRYGLPEESAVKLIIYDILGREVRSWQWQRQDAGYHYVTWDGRNNIGQPISTGVYIYRIVAGDFVRTRKMVLLK